MSPEQLSEVSKILQPPAGGNLGGSGGSQVSERNSPVSSPVSSIPATTVWNQPQDLVKTLAGEVAKVLGVVPSEVQKLPGARISNLSKRRRLRRAHELVL